MEDKPSLLKWSLFRVKKCVHFQGGKFSQGIHPTKTAELNPFLLGNFCGNFGGPPRKFRESMGRGRIFPTQKNTIKKTKSTIPCRYTVTCTNNKNSDHSMYQGPVNIFWWSGFPNGMCPDPIFWNDGGQPTNRQTPMRIEYHMPSCAII